MQRSELYLYEGGVYRHKASGNLYRVLETGLIIEATCEEAVMYMSLPVEYYERWIRPVKEFVEKFERVDPISQVWA